MNEGEKKKTAGPVKSCIFLSEEAKTSFWPSGSKEIIHFKPRELLKREISPIRAPPWCNTPAQTLLWATSHEGDLYWMDQQHWVLLPRIQALDPAGHFFCTACKSHWTENPSPRSSWTYLHNLQIPLDQGSKPWIQLAISVPSANPTGPGKTSSGEGRMLCKPHAGLWKQAKQEFNLCLVSFDISSCAVRH